MTGDWRAHEINVVAPLPPPKGGKSNACNTAPNYLMIPSAAKQAQGAWEFAKFCVGFEHPEDGGRHMGEMGWIPDDPEVAKSQSYQAYLRKYPQFRVFVDLMSSPNLGMFPQGPLQKFVDDELGKADEEVARGSQTPEAALALVEKHMAAEKARLKKLGQPIGEIGE